MNKTLLIIQREYLSRVKDKTFILTTILTPLLFVAFIVGATYLSIKGKEQLSIAVVDNNGYFKNNLKSSGDLRFEFPPGVDTTNYLEKGYDAILTIPPFKGTAKTEYTILSKKSIGIGTKDKIEDKVNAVIEDHMLQQAGLQRTQLDSIHRVAQFAELKSLQERSDRSKGESNQGLAYGIGYGSGILIYLTMLLYGMMLMRGVMEEKTNRIAEVIVSSVKPFQLMMGKIVGIGAVGLTQFLMWAVLIVVLSGIATSFIPHDTLKEVQALQQNGGIMAGNVTQASEQAQRIYNMQHTLGTANWPLIIGCFVFYFLGGYLFYASLFAAVGSVTEDIQGSRNLTMPITMPIVFSFIIMTTAVTVPDSKMAIWASIIPFSSPMVMMARIAYGVPGTVSYVQLISSMLLLVVSFLFTTWLAGKIYRTGILMYGKKVTWGEMFRWAFKKV